MSVVLSLLLLVLKCFEFYQSDARSLDIVRTDPDKHLQYSTNKNNDGKLNPGSAAYTQPGRRYDSVHHKVPGNPQKEKYSRRRMRLVQGKEELDEEYSEAGNGFLATALSQQSVKTLQQSLSSVSRRSVRQWKRIRERKKNPNPGFNLDYSRPRTHPPVHN